MTNEQLAAAGEAAHGELTAKAHHLLTQFDLEPDMGVPAAVGCVFVYGIAQWAADNGLLAKETADVVQVIAGLAVEALHAVAGITHD